MYDWPEVQGHTDAFWAAVRQALPSTLDAPAHLSRPDDISAPWRDSGLLLGQTCGLPYVSGRCAEAVPVARPVYDVPGARGGLYASALVCRSGAGTQLADFRGATAAINEPGSQSGMNALADAVVDVDARGSGGFFGEILHSGAHRRSATMVADGEADLAAIDAVAWALFGLFEPDRHSRLHVVAWTRPMPALPFITARPAHRDDLLAALRAGCRSVSGPGIPVDVLPAGDADYDPIRRMAARVGTLDLGPAASSS